MFKGSSRWPGQLVARHGRAAGRMSVTGHKAGPAVWYASRNSPELLTLSRPAGRRKGKERGPCGLRSLLYGRFIQKPLPLRFSPFEHQPSPCLPEEPSLCLLFPSPSLFWVHANRPPVFLSLLRLLQDNSTNQNPIAPLIQLKKQ